jgi:hypothetical protein
MEPQRIEPLEYESRPEAVPNLPARKGLRFVVALALFVALGFILEAISPALDQIWTKAAYLVFPILFIPALYFGRQAREWRKWVKGSGGRVTAALCTIVGGLGLVFYVLGFGGSCLMDRTYGPGGTVMRSRCQANLRTIVMSCKEYARQNGGQFPASFNDILPDTGPGPLCCPADDLRPNGRSYVYCGETLTTASPPDSVIAYEPLSNHDGADLHVLYLDGTVRWLPKQEATEFLAKRGMR